MLDANKETLGFCPIGEFYNSKAGVFTGEIKDVKNCKKCVMCHETQGNYISNGCLGDKDSICDNKDLPVQVYLHSHSKNSLFHQYYPKHSHKLVNGNDSSLNHQH